MDSTFSLSFPFEFKPFDGTLPQINGISNEIIYPKLNQETIICYRLSATSGTFFLPSNTDFERFKESNALSGEFNQGIVLTLNYSYTIPIAFQ